MLFHRVIRDFMIQGGDPDSKTASPGQSLGTGGPGYTIEAEIRKDLFHKRGALAAARQGDQVNPQRRSSGSQFYIVWGQIYKEGQLRQLSKQMEMQQMQQIFDTLAMEHRDEVLRLRKERNHAGLQELQDKLVAETEAKFKAMKEKGEISGLSDEQIRIYTTVGGTPHLDGQYTVFGEVVEGLDVVEKIQDAETSSSDRPEEDIKMTMTILE